MPVLLHTPTLAESLSAEAAHQYECLVSATCQVLNASGIDWKRHHSASYRQSIGDKDTIIRVECSLDAMPFTAIEPDPDSPYPTLLIKPVYPGALTRHDIALDGISVPPNDLLAHSLRPTAEADHYGSFATLPLSLTNAAGLTHSSDSTQQHLLFVVAESSTEVDTYDQDIDELLSFIDKQKSITTLTIVAGGNVNGSKIQHYQRLSTQIELITNRLRQKTDIPIFTLDLKSIDPALLLPLMGKFDLALFAGSALYIDAIQIGVPVYGWRLENDAASILNSKVDYSAHHCWSEAKKAINLQQRAIVRDTQVVNGRITIDNHLSRFEQVLHHYLTEHLSTFKTSGSLNITDGSTVISAHTIYYPGSQENQTQQTLGILHRKLRKFGQSPTRFIRDSDNPLAKKLHPFLPKPAA